MSGEQGAGGLLFEIGIGVGIDYDNDYDNDNENEKENRPCCRRRENVPPYFPCETISGVAPYADRRQCLQA